MSLINEALKKAQRQRAAEAAASAPGTTPPTTPIAKRAEPRSANTVVLIASGAVVLVVLSVIITVFLLNSSDTPAPVQPKSPPAGAPKAIDMPAPVLTPPVIKTPETNKVPGAGPGPTDPSTTPPEALTVATNPPVEPKSAAPAPKAEEPARSTPASPAETPKSAATTPPVATEAKSAATPPTTTTPPAPTTPKSAAAPVTTNTAPPPAAPAPAPGPAKPDERVQAFVDAVRVTAVRPMGNDSRVFMNDRFFRVNDIVDRTLGVRLVKVAPDSLTFSDANGVTYVKYF